jgi:hypothetical protein
MGVREACPTCDPKRFKINSPHADNRVIDEEGIVNLVKIATRRLSLEEI